MAQTAAERLLQRLSNARRKSMARAIKMSRTPWQHRQKWKTVYRLTPIEKALLVKKRRECKETLNEALHQAREEIWKQALTLREHFQDHSHEYYYRLIMQRPRKSPNHRRVNIWNAFQHRELRHLNDALAPDVPKYKTSDVMDDLRAKWNAMSKEEHVVATQDDIKSLEEKRDMKRYSKHNVALAAFSDAQTTFVGIQDELQALSVRTGVETLLIAVRMNSEFYNNPLIFYSNQRLADYLEMTTKTSVGNYAVRMEGFVISGVEGFIGNHVQQTLQLKARISELVLTKANEVSPVPIKRMVYHNFEENITAKYRLAIVNYPLKKFCCPSDVSSKSELEVLFHAWESGVTYWKHLSDEEFDQWETARFKAKMAEMRSNNDDDGDDARISITDRTYTARDEASLLTDGYTDSQSISDPNATAADITVARIVPTTLAITTASTAVNSTASSNVPSSSTTPIHTVDIPTASIEPNKRRRTSGKLFANFINVNVVSSSDGSAVPITKTMRKQRSDKGKK